MMHKGFYQEMFLHRSIRGSGIIDRLVLIPIFIAKPGKELYNSIFWGDTFMAKIAVFTTTDEFYHAAKLITGDFSSSFLIYQVNLQNAARMAVEVEAAGCGAIVVRSVLYKLL
jgi:hypothetical protein